MEDGNGGRERRTGTEDGNGGRERRTGTEDGNWERELGTGDVVSVHSHSYN